MQPPPEHLGSFYLGAVYDLPEGKRTDIPVNYEARDLATHAITVGMTGSGKTGLCLGLLEEAAIDGVPAILIDPKGDISNLVLQFPDLTSQDFAPWIDPDDARREGKSVAESAAEVAARWRQGLDSWGIGPERLRTLKEAVEYAIYTPGSDAGIPVNILGSLAAPRLNFDEHSEIVRERISGTVNALLGFVGISADPVQSRETILLSTIFEHFWRQNQDLDLARLIHAIQNPPVRQLGVLDVDTFYAEKERFALAMAFNNLLASPGFQNWLQGQVLDVDALLYTEDGKPRHSIFYVAHLPAQERMFFVTLLLESVLTWVRRQPGTNSLRAILYFDEAYGFLPPVAQPPSKRPLMTLVKQGRAVGLGCVLATQNPADIDYKGLTNTGTWFIGRLQAERDKARVIEGLRDAIAESGGDSQRVDFERIIGQLKPRLFLMHNVHENQPVVFQTRWAMSYLHGPLTRTQVKTLAAARARRPQAASPAPVGITAAGRAEPAARPAGAPTGFSATRQVLDPAIPQFFLPVTISETTASQHLFPVTSSAGRPEQAQLVYRAAILGAASVRFFDRKHDIFEERDRVLLAPVPGPVGTFDWNAAEEVNSPLGELGQRPAQTSSLQGPFFAPAPEAANSAVEFKGIAKALADWLYYNSHLTLLAHPDLDLVQQPDESEQEFKQRLQHAARERRDAEVDALRKRYTAQIEKVETRLRRQERELEQDESDYDARKRESLIATGEMLLTLLTRRRVYRTASWTASRNRLAQQSKMELSESRQELDELEAELAQLQAKLEEEIVRITPRWVDILKALTPQTLRPRRSDVEVKTVGLAWVPSWLFTYVQDGETHSTAVPAFRP
jgi:hypothetical protein